MHALHKCCAHLAQEPCTRGPARAPLHERFARGSRLATTAPPSALARICTAAPPFARGLCTPCTRALLTLHHDPACKMGGAAVCTSPSCALHEGTRGPTLHDGPAFARGFCVLCTWALHTLHLGSAPPQHCPEFGSTRLFSALLGSIRLRSGCGPNPTASPWFRLHSDLLGSVRPRSVRGPPLRNCALCSAPFGCARLYSARFGSLRAVVPTLRHRRDSAPLDTFRLSSASLGQRLLRTHAPSYICK